MIYYTADPHFCYEPLLAGRPFETVEEMDRVIIEKWNRRVGPEDTVYLIGDVGYNGGHVPCRILKQLRGHKHLIRGNHDTAFADAPLLYRYFETVSDFLEIDDGPNHVFLSHYPMLYDKPVGFMVHGHLHKNPKFHHILKEMPQILNAGVDINNFEPVTLPELMENNRRYYAQPPASLPPRREGKGLLPGRADFRPIHSKPRDHRKHLFLTGPKRVGKSTVLARLLDGRDWNLGGFRTCRIPTEAGCSVHMVSPGTQPVFTPDNQLFWKIGDTVHQDPSAFDRLGRACLADCRNCDLILMDELGPNEARAAEFQQLVLDCLDGDIPVYGILQLADSEFLDKIKARPDVHLLTVTEENRDGLPRMLLELGW